ncbi:MAG TPA: substrate-binding domain-containing protein [Gammaproteobacteria bacterium]
MDDEFLYRLRKRPPPEFAARLKAALDRRAPVHRFSPRTRFVRGIAAAALVGAAAAFAVLMLSMPGLFRANGDGAGTAEPPTVARDKGEGGSTGAVKPQLQSNAGGTVKPAGGGAPSAAKPSAGSGAPAAETPDSDADAEEGSALASAPPGVAVARSRARTGVSISSQAYRYVQETAEGAGVDSAFFIESTADGMEAFCGDVRGVAATPAIVRFGRLSAAELAACATAPLGEIIEIKIGYDALVLGRSHAYAAFPLSVRQVFLALAREVPDDRDQARVTPNRNRSWSDIDPALPYEPIDVVGPAADSVLGESLITLLEAGCRSFPELLALEQSDDVRYERVCRTLRDDSAYDEMSEGFELLQRIETYPNAFGVVSFAFFDGNRDRLDAAPLGGVEPSLEVLADGSYPASRTLYLYVRERALAARADVRQLVDFLVSSDFALTPPAEDERREIRALLSEASSRL